jgi:hypothetical protein
MAEVALRLLVTADFCPGFKEEPGWLACLEDAMCLVNRDVAATGIRRPCRLRVHDEGLNWSTNAYVETWDGYTGIAEGIYPADGADPVSALVAVADDVQDALMQTFPPCSQLIFHHPLPTGNSTLEAHSARRGSRRTGVGHSRRLSTG